MIIIINLVLNIHYSNLVSLYNVIHNIERVIKIGGSLVYCTETSQKINWCLS